MRASHRALTSLRRSSLFALAAATSVCLATAPGARADLINVQFGTTDAGPRPLSIPAPPYLGRRAISGIWSAALLLVLAEATFRLLTRQARQLASRCLLRP